MIWVRLENEEQRRKVLERKKNLKGENCGGLDMEGKENEMETRRYSKSGGEEKRKSVGYGKINIMSNDGCGMRSVILLDKKFALGNNS